MAHLDNGLQIYWNHTLEIVVWKHRFHLETKNIYRKHKKRLETHIYWKHVTRNGSKLNGKKRFKVDEIQKMGVVLSLTFN